MNWVKFSVTLSSHWCINSYGSFMANPKHSNLLYPCFWQPTFRGIVGVWQYKTTEQGTLWWTQQRALLLHRHNYHFPRAGRNRQLFSRSKRRHMHNIHSRILSCSNNFTHVQCKMNLHTAWRGVGAYPTFGWKAGYTLDKWLPHHRTSYAWCMFM